MWPTTDRSWSSGPNPVSGRSSTVRRWRPSDRVNSNRGLLSPASARAGDLAALGLSDGRVFAVATADDIEPVELGAVDQAVRDLAWSEDDSAVLVGAGDSFAARMFDARGEGQLGPDLVAEGGISKGSTAVAFLDGNPVVANGPVVQFDAATGREIGRIGGLEIRNNGWLAPVGDGVLLASGGSQTGGGYQVHRIDLGQGQAEPLQTLDAGPSRVAFVGTDIIVTLSHGALAVSTSTGERLIGKAFPASPGPPNISASENGELVVSGILGDLRIWRVPEVGPAIHIDSVAGTYGRIRSDVLFVGIVGGSGPSTHRVWTDEDGLSPPRPLAGLVTAVGLSPDELFLVMPTRPDELVHVVELKSGETVIDLPAPASLLSAAGHRCRAVHDARRVLS